MTEEKDQKKQGNKLPFIVLALLVIAVVGVMTYRQMHTGGNENTCTVVPRSAFGQGQTQSWVEMKSAATAAIGAGFELDYPQEAVNSSYDSVKYWCYTGQIDEHRYYEGETEVFRISKGKMCGQALYTPDSTYPSTVVAKVGDVEVTEYGDGNTVTAVSWTSGEYSYFIGAFGTPMSREEFETLVREVK